MNNFELADLIEKHKDKICVNVVGQGILLDIQSVFVRHEGDIVIDTEKVDEPEPFNPEELPGFKKQGKIFKTKFSYIDVDESHMYQLSKGEYGGDIKWSLTLLVRSEGLLFSVPIIERIKIPDHRFALELLRNLGVIE